MFSACSACQRAQSTDELPEDVFAIKDTLDFQDRLKAKSGNFPIEGHRPNSSASRLPVTKSAPSVFRDNGPSEDFYVKMSDYEIDDSASELLTAQYRVKSLRLTVLLLGCLIVFLISVVLGLVYCLLPPEDKPAVAELAKKASIPVVGLLFTWFHIWLAIQMMFLPVEFVGLWNVADTGLGIGWQGVVPRKARKMATLSYSCARKYLEGPRDWLGRVDPKALVMLTRSNLSRILEEILGSVGTKHFPQTWNMVPNRVRAQIVENTITQIRRSSPELWAQITDILADKTVGIDNDKMVVTVFVENKVLLNQFFLSLGDKEFRFIEHCGATMGFVLGLVQLVAFDHLDPVGRAIFLPATGFFLGIVTNWLAITMCFKPCFPHPVRIFGWHICDIQGRFLKRQADVAKLYSKMLCNHFLQFDKVMEYLQTQPETWNQLKTVFVQHNARIMHQAMSLAVEAMKSLGILPPDAYEKLEDDMQILLVEGLAKDEQMHAIASRYVSKVTDIERRNAEAIRGMAPDEFENLLHPAFKEDEWMLILVGGVLGLMVGGAQAYFLSS